MDVAYFPGCSLHGMAKEYDVSTRAVCRHLGVSLQELQDWNCCGATAAHSLDHLLSVRLNARNLAIADDTGLGCLMTPCAGCFSRLKGTSYELSHNEIAAGPIQALGLKAEPHVKVQHLLQLLDQEVGSEVIGDKVVKSLQGLKVAAYYGCLITRPREVTGFDDSEQPMVMDKILETLGAEAVPWSHKTECCGGGFAASDTAIVIDLGGQVLEAARQAGADAIITACPMCQTNLDARQPLINQDRGKNFNLPVIYLTQLMGLAFGYSFRQMGLSRLMVNPTPLLRSKHVI